jgi:hypothetical protein
MLIDIKRCPDEQLADKLMQATYFFAKEVMSRQMLGNIFIEIRLLKSMRDYGMCVCIDDMTNAHGKPRGFEIALKSTLDEKMMMTTLAHELVHVQQYATGRLADDHRKWCASKMKDDINYEDQPWEIEANMMEAILLDKYKEQYGLSDSSLHTCTPIKQLDVTDQHE